MSRFSTYQQGILLKFSLYKLETRRMRDGFPDIGKKRYSVRAYKDQPVEEEKLRKILEAGRVAPTGANKQPQHLIVVTSQQGRKKAGQGSQDVWGTGGDYCVQPA